MEVSLLPNISNNVSRSLVSKPLPIAPSSPWQNGYAKTFILRFKDECLNRELFGHLLEAQVGIEEHRKTTIVFVHIQL